MNVIFMTTKKQQQIEKFGVLKFNGEPVVTPKTWFDMTTKKPHIPTIIDWCILFSTLVLFAMFFIWINPPTAMAFLFLIGCILLRIYNFDGVKSK